MTIICPWCSALVTGNRARCPECDFDCDSDCAPASSPSPEGLAPRAATRSVQGGIAPLLFFMISSLFAVCLSMMLQQMPLPSFGSSAAPVHETAPRYNDPQLQSVWLRGLGSVRTALNSPAYRSFSSAYLRRSAGAMTTLCGTVDGSAGTGAIAGMRFLSLSGRLAGTVIEGTTPSFETLWARLCNPQQGSW